MPVKEASSQETPYGRWITSEGWFVLNLADALAVRNDEKGRAVYPLGSREAPFGDFGVNVKVLWPGQPNAIYHAESGQEGFLVLAGDCTLISEAAAKYGASAAKDTNDGDEAHATGLVSICRCAFRGRSCPTRSRDGS
jgi:hypothetical protein